MEQMMSNLPSFRLISGHPFESTAMDYFGPFEIKYGYKGRKKSYGAVFTCLTTRAVHVELVSDMSSDMFCSLLGDSSASMEHLKGSTVTMAAILLVQPKNYG